MKTKSFKQLFEWQEKSKIRSREGKTHGKYKMFVCSDTDIKKYDSFLCKKESLIFGTGGKPSMHYCNEKFAYSTDCIVACSENKEIYLKYVYWFFRQKNLKILQNGFKGSGLQHISKKYIEQIELTFPSFDEQNRIVSRIEELFSELDNGIATLKKIKQQLAVYRQAVLKEAFEGDYPKIALKEISIVISGHAFKSKRYTANGQYVVVKIGNIKHFKFDFSRNLTKTNEIDGNILNKYLLRRGDCLITLTGSRGKRDYGYVSMITDENNYLLNQRVAALRFDLSKVFPQFYQYYLSSYDYRNQFFSYETGNVGQGNVGIKALTNPLVVYPTLEQQKQIVSEIESRLSVCDSIEKAVDTALQQAEAMRQSILKKAFEGEL